MKSIASHKTVVYTGPKTQFRLHEPRAIIFFRNVPQRVPGAIARVLPSDVFTEVVSQEQYSEFSATKPILFRMPGDLFSILSLFKSVERVRQIYPTSPITILNTIRNFDCIIDLLKIDNMSIISSFDTKFGQWLKEYDWKYQQVSPIFSPAMLLQYTKEFAYLLHYKIQEKDVDKQDVPTILKNSAKRKHIVIITNGQTLGSAIDLPIRGSEIENLGLPVVYISSKTPLKESLENIRHAKYLISLGDSDLNFLAAYLGVPLFAFFFNTENLHLVQLMKFNKVKEGSVTYSGYPNKPPDEVISKLCNYVAKYVAPEKYQEPEQKKSSERAPVELIPEGAIYANRRARELPRRNK